MDMLQRIAQGLNFWKSRTYPIPYWPPESLSLSDDVRQELVILNEANKAELPNYTDLNEFIEASNTFPIKFPIDTARCKTLKEHISETVLLRNINSVYPVLHECVLPLFINFIHHKRNFGSNVEKEFYKNMNLLNLVDRLLNKRAVRFVGRCDKYVLLNGVRGLDQWETIGKDDQEGALTLENCLSYDEIKLSAFLSVSSYTYYINDGNRKNKGITSTDRTNLQDEGIIIGLIGPRVVKKNCMEYQEIIVESEQNTEERGYGRTVKPTVASLFSDFYGKSNWTFKDFSTSDERNKYGHFKEIYENVYFDNITYSKRLSISIDTLLFEANHRAREKSTTAYIHVVGIGLGVWMISIHQTEVFMETFAKRIEFLGKYLHNISDLHFAYFSNTKKCGKYSDGSKIPIEGHPNGGIRVFVSLREPHEAVVGVNKGKLLVVSYAWDANALPGNEYWDGYLTSSSDPAAASSTQIAELHNPHINRKVSAANLKIAAHGRVYDFKDYIQNSSENI